jgi:hypothetical protein
VSCDDTPGGLAAFPAAVTEAVAMGVQSAPKPMAREGDGVSWWLWLAIQGGWCLLAGLVLWRCRTLLREVREVERRLASIQQTLEAHLQRLNGGYGEGRR